MVLSPFKSSTDRGLVPGLAIKELSYRDSIDDENGEK